MVHYFLDTQYIMHYTHMNKKHTLCFYWGLWSSQFDAEDTREGDFTLANGDTVETDFMSQVRSGVGIYYIYLYIALGKPQKSYFYNVLNH